MKPCASLMMCGGSATMNSYGEFDSHTPFEDLHDIEALIYKLRDLLTTALPDDLLDDESSSLSSSLSPDKISSPEPWEEDVQEHQQQQQRQQHQLPDWMNNLDRLRNNLQQGLHHHQQQTSTPQGGVHLPPLKTPAAYQEYEYGSRNAFPVHNKDPNIELQRYGNGEATNYNGGRMADYDRGEVEGADSDQEYDHQQNRQWNHQKQNHNVYSNGGKDLIRQPSTDYNSDGIAYTTCTEDEQYQEQQYGDVSQHEHQNGGNYAPGQQQNGGGRNGVGAPNPNGVHQNGGVQQHYGPMGDPANGNGYYIDQNWTEPHQLPPPPQNQKQVSRPVNGITENGQGHNGAGASVPQHVHYRGDGADGVPRHHGNGGVQQNGMGLHQCEEWERVNGSQGAENGTGAERNFHTNPIPGNGVQNGNHAISGNAQQQFMQTVNGDHSRQLAQLEILYKAKSMELEQVSRQLEAFKEESAREKRILNHQLAMVNGEKDGLTTNFEQSRQLVVKHQQEKAKVEEQYEMQGEQMKQLIANHEELTEKFQTAQCTIENLAQQLQAVQMSDPNTKFGRDRKDLLASIQEKNEKELNIFRDKLDKATKIANEKDTELKTLQEELSMLRKTLDQTRVEHGEVVNKLSKSLEESQAQCRQYLQSGAADEVNQLQLQLKQTKTARNMSENMCKSLQEELEDLKEHVQMYESAASLGVGVISSKMSPKHSESFGIRNLNKEDWETPKLTRNGSSDNNDDMIKKLRQELDRALGNNRMKRNQLKQVQDDLKASKEECEKHKEEVEEAEFQVKDLQVQIKMLQSSPNLQSGHPRSILHKRRATLCVGDKDDRRVSIGSIEARRNTSELGSLRNDCEALKKKLEKKVEENAELKKQMVDMIGEHDEDKQVSLDRVQNTCIQLHEDRSKQMRENLVSEWESERDMLKEAHQHQLQEIKSELEAVQKELCEVKEDYLRVCEEKNQIEDDVKKKLTTDAENQLAKTMEELSTAKEKALEDLQLSLKNKYRVDLMNAKSEWQKEAKEQADTELQIKLSDARLEWVTTACKQATDSARQAVEAEWQSKLESEVESKLTEQLIQAKKDLELKHKTDKEEECHRIQAVCEEKYKSSLQDALAKMEAEWQEKLQVATKQKIQEAIKDCNQKWMAGDTDTRELVDQRIVEERTKWLRETVDWEEIKTTWMDQEGRSLIQGKVSEAREELEQKHSQVIAVLERKYDELDAERRRCIKEAEEKLAQEHKEFLKDHEETMRNAIQAVKAGCEKEKVELLHQKSLEFEQNLTEKERHWEADKQEIVDRLEQIKQQTTQQQSEELHNLRKQLRNSQDELHQTEQRLKRELQHMQGQLTSANSATMEALEGRMTEMQRKHVAVVAKLKEGHERERLEWRERREAYHRDGETMGQAIQTDPVEKESSQEGLNELRSHYLSTVNKIRSDVLKYVTDMREQCRRTVHEEVKKERNTTAKKLRQYYLRCLHQLMEEDRSSGSVALNKFIAMATALEFPDDDRKTRDGQSAHNRPPSRTSSTHQESRCSSRQSSRSTSPSEMTEPSQSLQEMRMSSTQSSRCSSRQSSRASSPEMITNETSGTNGSSFQPISKPSQVTTGGLNDNNNCRLQTHKVQSNQDGLHNRNSYNSTEMFESETFSRLSRQPREFNPSPERLPASQSATSSSNQSITKNNSVISNITIRIPNVVVDAEYSSGNRDDVDESRNNERTYQSTNLSENKCAKQIDDTLPSRQYHSAVQSHAGYTANYDDRKSISRTNVSSVSLATEYNDLPDSLDIGDEVLRGQVLNETGESSSSHYGTTDKTRGSNETEGRPVFKKPENYVTTRSRNVTSVRQASSGYGSRKSLSNRNDQQRQEDVMSRSQRDKSYGHSRLNNVKSRPQSEEPRSRYNVSSLQSEKSRESNLLSRSQGNRSKQDVSRSLGVTSRQDYTSKSQRVKSRDDSESLVSQCVRSTEGGGLSRSQRELSRRTVPKHQHETLSRSQGDKTRQMKDMSGSHRDMSRQDVLSRSQGDKSRQDLSRTQRDMSLSQSHLPASVVGASKLYRKAQYQDSGFDSPHVE